MAESKGIKETKEVMEFIFSFVDAIGKAKADDKFLGQMRDISLTLLKNSLKQLTTSKK